MQAHIESNQKVKFNTELRLGQRLIQAAASMFAVSGLVMLYGAMDNIPPLRQPDAVFGLSTRTVLIVAGLVHLMVSYWLITTREPMTQGLVCCWAGLNYIVYIVGLGWLKVAASIPVVSVLAWELSLSEKMVNIVWLLFIGYLWVVGLMFVVLEWRRGKWLEAEELFRRWHEVRGMSTNQNTPRKNINNLPVALPPHSPPVSRELLLRAEFKFSCPTCGQHIQCSNAYSGKVINCPACQKQIEVPS